MELFQHKRIIKNEIPVKKDMCYEIWETTYILRSEKSKDEIYDLLTIQFNGVGNQLLVIEITKSQNGFEDKFTGTGLDEDSININRIVFYNDEI